jgi:hypothetical protein
MLEVFSESKGIFHQEYIPEGLTVSRTMYRDILRGLREAITGKTP